MPVSGAETTLPSLERAQTNKHKLANERSTGNTQQHLTDGETSTPVSGSGCSNSAPFQADGPDDGPALALWRMFRAIWRPSLFHFRSPRPGELPGCPLLPSSPARRRGSLEIFQNSSFQGCNRNSQTDHSFASLQDRQAGSPRQLLAGVISDISEENPPCQLQLAICFHGK